MSRFIEENEITSKVFESLEILNEQFIVESLQNQSKGNSQDILTATFDAKAQFKVFT